MVKNTVPLGGRHGITFGTASGGANAHFKESVYGLRHGKLHRFSPSKYRYKVLECFEEGCRFLSRGALEASQLRQPTDRGPCPSIKRRTEGLRVRTCCRRHATSISSVTVAPGRIPMPGVQVGGPLQPFPPPE